MSSELIDLLRGCARGWRGTNDVTAGLLDDAAAEIARLSVPPSDDKRHGGSPLTEHEIMVLREEMLSDDGFLPEGKERVARLCDMALASIVPSAVACSEPAAWRYRERLPVTLEWSDWRHVGHKPQGPTSGRFEMEPLYSAPQSAKLGRSAPPVEWTEWRGGDIPCALDAMVNVRFRDGDEHSDVAGNWIWGHSNQGDDIVAYRASPSTRTPKEK